MLLLIPWLLLVSPSSVQEGIQSDAESLLEVGHWSPSLRPDSRGYLGTSSGPVVSFGGAKLSIEHSRTELEGLRDRSKNVSADALLGTGYSQVPTTGSVDRTEVRAEYGLGDATTLRITIPIESRVLHFVDGVGDTSKKRAQGLADVLIGAGVELSHKDGERAEFELMVAVPTGKTRARETDSGGPAAPLLPYDLQLGGGTYVLQPSFTWTHWSSHWSFGSSAGATIPVGHNDRGWSRGDELRLNSWISRRVDPFRSVVLGAEYLQIDSIQGRDDAMDSTFDPSFDPTFTGGKMLSLDFGLHMIMESNNRLAFEIGAPLWQETEGPQVEEDYHFTVAWWLSF